MLHTNPHEDRIIRNHRLMAFPNESLPRAWQGKKIDFVLLAYFALWYLGNYYYNITNK